MTFDFATASRIVFGAGAAAGTGKVSAEFGSHALVVTRRQAEAASRVIEALESSGLRCTRYSVTGEPTVSGMRSGSQIARESGCDLVVAVGGGSVIDAGKAMAALVSNSGEPLDYLEVIGAGKPFENAPLPFIALPTTAGTGSEVTRNAVLGSPEHGVKASLRSPQMLPRVAIVDPELTLDVPPAVTASTGLDALTQLIEPYVSVRANPMTDMYCLEGIPRTTCSLERACLDGTDLIARTNMSWASLLGGLALANAGLGIVHGFAAPVGGMFEAPHGAVCAALLPFAMRVNIHALRDRDPNGIALKRYSKIAMVLTGAPSAEPEDGSEWVAELCTRLRVPRLSAYGVTLAEIDPLIEKASRASSTKGNPIALTADELRSLIETATFG